LPQFVEQPRVLDGDDGLSGEVLYQRDLFVGEWPDFLSVDADDTDQSILLEHRDTEGGPITPEVDARNHKRIAFDVGLYFPDIVNVDHLFASRYAAQNAIRWRPDHWLALPRFSIRRRSVVHGRHAKGIGVPEIECPEFGLADTCRILQYGLKDRIQLAWR
jgi:hypothetical protein